MTATFLGCLGYEDGRAQPSHDAVAGDKIAFNWSGLWSVFAQNGSSTRQNSLQDRCLRNWVDMVKAKTENRNRMGFFLQGRFVGHRVYPIHAARDYGCARLTELFG